MPRDVEPIVISHESALTAWRHRRENGGKTLGGNWGRGTERNRPPSSALSSPQQMQYARLTLMPERPPSDKRIAEVIGRHTECISAPVDICVSNRSDKMGSRIKRVHCCSKPLPRKSLVKLHDSDSCLLIVAPPLMLAQLANSGRSPIEVIRLAYEFCGTYCKASDGNAVYSRVPVASSKSLVSYCSNWANIQGNGQRPMGICALEDIAALVLDNSASPMETAVAMLGFLPHRLGGFGIPSPKLNYKVWLSDKERALLRKRELYLDAYWEDAKVALEYDSRIFHGTAKERTDDSKRRDFLLGKGITVITLTIDQVQNYSLFHNVMMQLARKLGFRFRVRMRNWDRRHAKLRGLLLGTLC